MNKKLIILTLSVALLASPALIFAVTPLPPTVSPTQTVIPPTTPARSDRIDRMNQNRNVTTPSGSDRIDRMNERRNAELNRDLNARQDSTIISPRAARRAAGVPTPVPLVPSPGSR